MSYNTQIPNTEYPPMFWRWNLNPNPGPDPDFSKIKTKTKHKKHPKSWNNHTHYGQCGQSCPCCRAQMGESFGGCTICRQ